MSKTPSSAGSPPVYRTKPLQPHLEDSYGARGKYAEPTLCPDCHAVFHKGHWQWLSPPPSAQRQPCPACRRIRDQMPAGYLSLGGDFLAGHTDELLALVRNIEKREKAERPLNRIMAITEQDGGLLITTTDAHLARGIGEAVRHAYQGSLDIQHAPDENLARVSWKR